MEAKGTINQEQISGRCFCGKVRFQIKLPVVSIVFCHCNMCRRAHGADYSTWVRVAKSNFWICEGEMQLKRSDATIYSSRYFCEHCGTSVYTEDIRYPDICGVLRGVIESDIGQEPSKHDFYDRRQPWVEFDDGLPKFGGESGLELL